MGVDLALHPMAEFRPRPGDMWLSHTKLSMHRHSELWGVIAELRSELVPEQVSGYFGDEYKRVKKDSYGQPLKYVCAAVFRDFAATHPEVWEQMSEWNRRVVEFVASLSGGTEVVLYWH